MSTAPKPAFATTTSGARLPILSLPQGELLTLNVHEVPSVKSTLGPGTSVQLLRLDPEAGRWVVMVTLAPGAEVPIHYHTGTAEVYTLRGKWIYKEYPDQPQTAGSYLFEPGGSVHTLTVPEENTEDTVMLVMVTGANVNFSEDGRFHSVIDAVSLQYLLGKFAQDQGIKLRYIGAAGAGFAETE
ncbi:2,4'-dihydroxyacetophenone dioxygenase family protein [Streptomyces sp. NPDC057580]|uniref:2,4'-dihydroxyacetophenone dioxygenase family protein n=1 Tax=Streptomyces sp. NPDC057580 TaxID=3346173 RepID=UPI00369F434D